MLIVSANCGSTQSGLFSLHCNGGSTISFNSSSPQCSSHRKKRGHLASGQFSKHDNGILFTSIFSLIYDHTTAATSSTVVAASTCAFSVHDVEYAVWVCTPMAPAMANRSLMLVIGIS